MSSKKKEHVEFNDMIAAQEELKAVQKQYGIDNRTWFAKLVDKYFELREVKHPVNKKTYMILLLCTGWMGGHRYYAKHYVQGALYTVFCWAGIGIAMSIIDILVAIPIPADENGMFEI